MLYCNLQLTSCPRQLDRQKAVSMDQILTKRSSDPVITYLPERSNIAKGYKAKRYKHIHDFLCLKEQHGSTQPEMYTRKHVIEVDIKTSIAVQKAR